MRVRGAAVGGWFQSCVLRGVCSGRLRSCVLAGRLQRTASRVVVRRGAGARFSVRGVTDFRSWGGVTDLDLDRCNLYGSVTLLESQSDRVLGNQPGS